MRDKKYAEDYIRRPGAPATDMSEAAYVYTGVWYRLQPRRGTSAALGRRWCAYALAALALAVAMGLLDSAGSRSFVAALPYAGALLPLFLLLPSAYGVARAPERITRKQRDRGFLRAGRCALAAGILLLAALLGEALCCALGRPDAWPREFLYAALCAASSGLCFLLYKEYRETRCVPEETGKGPAA